MRGLEIGEALGGWPIGTMLLCLDATGGNQANYTPGKIYTIIGDKPRSIRADNGMDLCGTGAEWEVISVDHKVDLEELM